MRLLSVNSFTFTEFDPPDIPKYAIASHRWKRGTEAMLTNIQEGSDKLSEGYQKVQGFAGYIREHIPGIKWLWIDTCCIDQKNSLEVSEAINSMFRWYRDAEVCLAYLDDVPATKDLHLSSLEKSVWFQRGWTLQELLAPELVLFLDKDWKVIGHKGKSGRGRSGVSIDTGAFLERSIAAITAIPEAILRDYEQSHALTVDYKLQWMWNRHTTREEDYWYCLLGILGVNMNIRYGDGKTKERILNKLRKSAIATSSRGNDNVDAAGPALDPPRTASSNVPFRRDPDFIDRPALTEQITAMLAGPTGRAALVGLGGVGKSQLAIEYTWRLRERSPQIWVLWTHASNPTRFDQSIRDVADLLEIAGREHPKADLLQLLRNWLRKKSNAPWLVVLDNADDASFLLESPMVVAGEAVQGQRRIDHFPTCDGGSLLFTSRSKSEALRKLVYDTEIIDVRPMSEEEAEAMLEKKLGRPDTNYRELVRALECMPLAITQAAAYIRERGPQYSVQQYQDAMERSRTSRTSLLRRSVPLPNRDSDASNSILLTWQISFEHISTAQPSAAELLSVMSFCDRLAIPQILLYTESEQNEQSESLLSAFEDDISMLCNYSVISHTANAQTWKMHRLVQDATQIWLQNSGRLDEIYNHFIERLDLALPTSEFANRSLCYTLFPHAKNLLVQKPAGKKAQILWASIMYKSAWFTQEQGDYKTSLLMAEASQSIRLNHYGEESPLTMQNSALIALVYRSQGQLKKAEELGMKLLESLKTVLGAEHPDTLYGMLDLARTYRKQLRWKKAEELGVKVIETSRTSTVLGAEHANVLMSMSSLALTYQGQGRLKEAEELEVKVVEISRKTLGEEHPKTLSSMADLALTYWSQGRLREAEELGVKVVETLRKTLGEEHPKTLNSMVNLASIYRNQGRLKEAEELGAKVVETSRKTLGEEHPETLSDMCSLAATFVYQGRLQEAQDLFALCAEAQRRVLGADHPETKVSMFALEMTRKRIEQKNTMIES